MNKSGFDAVDIITSAKSKTKDNSNLNKAFVCLFLIGKETNMRNNWGSVKMSLNFH